ncbi:hypothetical protein OS493_010383 [Desmophyllum pertusum]|uniref:Uncharacterized protein n=1 Tax=Desmophyllum pertusum TaxID=174260 RepID=A0A9X0DAH2_9CNID|nr:hypothetical protein OS493_010383 [Desmophyllum pertusum]
MMELLRLLENIDGKLMGRVTARQGTDIWEETEVIAELVSVSLRRDVEPPTERLEYESDSEVTEETKRDSRTTILIRRLKRKEHPHQLWFRVKKAGVLLVRSYPIVCLFILPAEVQLHRLLAWNTHLLVLNSQTS